VELTLGGGGGSNSGSPGGRGCRGRGLRAFRRHKEPILGVYLGGGMAEVGVH